MVDHGYGEGVKGGGVRVGSTGSAVGSSVGLGGGLVPSPPPGSSGTLVSTRVTKIVGVAVGVDVDVGSGVGGSVAAMGISASASEDGSCTTSAAIHPIRPSSVNTKNHGFSSSSFQAITSRVSPPVTLPAS